MALVLLARARTGVTQDPGKSFCKTFYTALAAVPSPQLCRISAKPQGNHQNSMLGFCSVLGRRKWALLSVYWPMIACAFASRLHEVHEGARIAFVVIGQSSTGEQPEVHPFHRLITPLPSKLALRLPYSSILPFINIAVHSPLLFLLAYLIAHALRALL